jgi:hypothetical protein
MSIRLLADHDLNERIVEGVLRREPAAEFVRARELRWHELPDDELLARAAADQFVVVSHDVNTMIGAATRRMTAGVLMAGLLIAQQRQAIGPVIESLVMALAAGEPEDFANRIYFLPL